MERSLPTGKNRRERRNWRSQKMKTTRRMSSTIPLASTLCGRRCRLNSRRQRQSSLKRRCSSRTRVRRLCLLDIVTRRLPRQAVTSRMQISTQILPKALLARKLKVQRKPFKMLKRHVINRVEAFRVPYRTLTMTRIVNLVQ